MSSSLRHPSRASKSPSASSIDLLNPPKELGSMQVSPDRGHPRHFRDASSYLKDTPLTPTTASKDSLLDAKRYSLGPDPKSWGIVLESSFEEADDYLHNPDHDMDKRGAIFSRRAFVNDAGIYFVSPPFIQAALVVSLVTFFLGYPLISHLTGTRLTNLGAFNLGGINASGQIPDIGNFGLIDKDTPEEALTKASYIDGAPLELVFSDEFNVEGRTFYPGDDPYWEALDIHYWGTSNLEWYDPEALITRNGSLEITFSKKRSHALDYQGGIMTTWNKFCFTGGLLEASVMLPGDTLVSGFWPAIWTMGNLGRAGYGATLDGMWPYSYDSCDVGTAANQTKGGRPVAATKNGDPRFDGVLSFQPGQRLSRCTCPGESHPGPVHSDGTYVGRSVPEIDVFEAQILSKTGEVSQSLQIAPFDAAYEWFSNTSDNVILMDTTITRLNSYKGGVYQQAVSGVSTANQECYDLTGRCYSTYGFEYKPGYAANNAYVGWINDGKLSWRLNAGGIATNPAVEISDRPIPQEPMYIIANLGMSRSFVYQGQIDFDRLMLPATMRVDWIRVYQRPGERNIGCDPKDFPTQSYINRYMEAYTNANLTVWEDDFHQAIPKNSFLDQCSSTTRP